MKKTAIGIDLGTSNTVVASLRDETINVIHNKKNKSIHPSVVSFHPKGIILAGEEANRRRIVDPANTLYSVKRLIGRTFSSEAVQRTIASVPYQLIEGENEQPIILVREQQYTVPEISALVLEYIKNLAANSLGGPLSKVVITVPANFNDAQRESTRSAGQIAGLDVIRIINEPTAAALAYGFGRQLDARIAIYDFGGGTFDLSILQLKNDVFEVLGTGGDTFLGGDDIDNRLVDFMLRRFQQQTDIDLSQHLSIISRLRFIAENIKRQLSNRRSAVVQINELAYGPDSKPIDFTLTITRNELNEMAMDLVQRTFSICEEVLRRAQLTASHIDEVVLVGGTTLMPLVREGVRDFFSLGALGTINPMEIVAMGAAIQASILIQTDTLSGQQHQAVLLDVTPMSLGISVVGGYTDVIIKANAQLPLEQTRIFTTSQDNQHQVCIRVCQGEELEFIKNQELGQVTLENLRPAPRGEVSIQVTFEIDTNGILLVRAQDQETGRQQELQIKVLGTTSPEQLEQLKSKHEDLPSPIDTELDTLID